LSVSRPRFTDNVAVVTLVKGFALERMGTPQDMLGACLFLLSDEASRVTGQILDVDGGQVFR
jgi:NAD(P)-dependent dehydrogenase (short-subunit alcohol dehydrogenase family)